MDEGFNANNKIKKFSSIFKRHKRTIQNARRAFFSQPNLGFSPPEFDISLFWRLKSISLRI